MKATRQCRRLLAIFTRPRVEVARPEMKLVTHKRSFVSMLRALTGVLALSSPIGAFAAGGCPSINAIGNFLPSADLSASFTLSDTDSDTINDTATYDFTSTNEIVNPGDTVPGLIKYCVYPIQPPANPDNASALYDSWTTSFATIQGYFAFGRPGGNPTNVPFDGSTQTIGTAKWNAPTAAPTAQTILLHINDPTECDTLYGGNPGTCFVLPEDTTPPLHGCTGDTVACKEVVIDEADTSSPLTVPVNTKLHLHYTYLINNTTGDEMRFYIPGPKTKDINAGGGKDYFGCEQQPDPATGTPGAFGAYLNYQGTGLKLDFKAGSGVCDQSRFFLTNAGIDNPYVLASGDSILFRIDMVTRKNKGRKQEYTSCGPHLLNSGFTVKWFAPDDPLLHSFSTNTTPLYVNVVGCP